MPRIIITSNARANIKKRIEFLLQKSPISAQKAANLINTRILMLKEFPQMGKPVANAPLGFRDLVVRFGIGGYVIRYIFEEKNDVVKILAIRHTKEAGFEIDG